MPDPPATLREQLIAAARAELEDSGHAGVSLRRVARRANVSHAAPAYAFGDKSGMLTAVATQGFVELAASVDRPLEDGAAALAQLGRRYLSFASANPALYELMFRTEALRPDDELRRAQAASLRSLSLATGGTADTPAAKTMVAWAFAHGLVALTGQLPPEVGTLPETSDLTPTALIDLFASMAR